jgi:seryl-tRNA(Sec) selenium transferase
MEKEKIAIIGLVILLFFIIGFYFYSSYYYAKCEDSECFTNALVKCKRTVYDSDTTLTILRYKILGKEEEQCEINVELLQIKRGPQELAILEGQEMRCFPDYGTLTMPESDLKKCHGELKESIQEIVIDRLHSQIVLNLGKISEEINAVSKVL